MARGPVCSQSCSFLGPGAAGRDGLGVGGVRPPESGCSAPAVTPCTTEAAANDKSETSPREPLPTRWSGGRPAPQGVNRNAQKQLQARGRYVQLFLFSTR